MPAQAGMTGEVENRYYRCPRVMRAVSGRYSA